MRFAFSRGVRSALFLAALGAGWPATVYGLDCGLPTASYFESVNTNVDPTKTVVDLEARAALENLSPIVFSGRLTSIHHLSGPDTGIELLGFKDVKVLRGVLPRSKIDRIAMVAYDRWCDGGCAHRPLEWAPGAMLTIGVSPSPDKVTSDGKTLYRGRVDGQFGPCHGGPLSPLKLMLLAAPPEEIARLKRDYPPRQ
ncbi:hypothetical protein ACVIW2_004756 [Bradyrhizobium huanghuaihaiense]|uniref:Uncharacterized protein n=1 Tax=Bradyrhizobium huanghuaihaiense TaxID=990078 RepID=A0A562R4K5_9BRAD|nr:hypothetical protein [Bradyrhizobium huanghuaihaiense]TWI63989.1 hypothetical protein IQ16_05861 [Bradyrhizobium huanghuaihaiense]